MTRQQVEIGFHRLMVTDKVRGTYLGIPFIGTITAMRQHTMNHRITLFTVDVEQPFTLFNEERASIHFGASYDPAVTAKYNCSNAQDITIQAL